MNHTTLAQPRWLAPFHTGHAAVQRRILLCFPYGGGGMAPFLGLNALNSIDIAAWGSGCLDVRNVSRRRQRSVSSK